ncbi:unnamed protein product [Caenorhabditis angaria]|uniref:Condensin complex subunit 1 C-terminal domain-containing protein n=1 Tax=Caenorhabditis angaria TaxID=860376 RepID=A0A9P1IU31_9PELO|nr:unnamed protein product [Caenorhabditis angaria]
MQSIFYILIFISIVQSKNITNRLYNPLVCYVEQEGILNNKEYREEQHHEPCGPETKWCQKITANYINAHNERTQIVLKGCDTVSILPDFTGIGCHGNGCSERTYEDEIYTVCCCNTETYMLYSGISTISELLTLFLIYCIIAKSTDELKIYKTSLLKLALSKLFFGFSVAVLVSPDLLCPLPLAIVRSPIGTLSQTWAFWMMGTCQMDTDDVDLENGSDWTDYGGTEVEIKKEVFENDEMENKEFNLEEYEEFDIVSIEEVTIEVLAARIRRLLQEVINRGISIASQLFDVAAKIIYRSTILEESESNPVTSTIIQGTVMIILSSEERDEESSTAEKNIMMFVTKLAVFSKSQKCDELLKQLIIIIDKFFYHPDSKIRQRIYNMIGMLLVESNNIVEVENDEADNEYMFGDDDMSQKSENNSKLIEDAIIDRWAQKLGSSVLDKSPFVRSMALFALSQIDHQKMIKDRNGNEFCVNQIISRSLSDIDENVRRTAVKCIHIVTSDDIDKCMNFIEMSTENKIRHLMVVRMASSIHLLSFSESQRFRLINILRRSDSARIQDVIHQQLVESWLKDASEAICGLSLFKNFEIHNTQEQVRFDDSEVVFPSIILEYLNPMIDPEATSIFLKFAITRYIRATTGKESNVIDFEAFLKLLTDFGAKKCNLLGIMTRTVFKLIPETEKEENISDVEWIKQSYYRVFILRHMLDVVFQLTNDVSIRDRTLRFLVLGINPMRKHIEQFCDRYFNQTGLVEEIGDSMEHLIANVLHIFDVIVNENHDSFEITVYKNLLETLLSNSRIQFSPEFIQILTTKYIELNEDVEIVCDWTCYTANEVVMKNEVGLPISDDLQIALADDLILECQLKRCTAMFLALCKHPKVVKCTTMMSSVFKVLLPSLLSNKNEEIKFDGIELIGYSSIIDFENAVPYLKLCPLLLTSSRNDREKAVYLNVLTCVVKKLGFRKVSDAIFGDSDTKLENILEDEYSKLKNGTIEKCQASRDILSMLTSEVYFWPRMLANIMKVVFSKKMEYYKLPRLFNKFLNTSMKSLRNRVHLMRSFLFCVTEFDNDFQIELMSRCVFQHFETFSNVDMEDINSEKSEFSIEAELCRRLIRKSINDPRATFVKPIFSEFSTQLNIDFIPLEKLKEIQDLATRAAYEAEEFHIRAALSLIKKFVAKCEKTIKIKKRVERMKNGGDENESDNEEPKKKRLRYAKEVKEEEINEEWDLENENEEIVILDSDDDIDNEPVYVPRSTKSRKRKFIEEGDIKEEVENMEI